MTDKLIAINRLGGETAAEVMKIAETKLVTDRPVDGGTTTVLVGIMSGILSGLAADLLAGGLTLGTGALVGGVLGATGGAALAKGYNVYTSKDKKVVGWSPNSLTEAFGKSLMLYLAIAHFGRGQGQWRPKEAPKAWGTSVSLTLNRYTERLQLLWPNVGSNPKTARAQIDCATLVRQSIRDVLVDLHPESNALHVWHPRETMKLS